MLLLFSEIAIKTISSITWYITYKLYIISYYLIYKEYPKNKEQLLLEKNNKKIEELEFEIIEMKYIINLMNKGVQPCVSFNEDNCFL